MLIVSKVDTGVAVYNDKQGAVVLVNVSGLEACVEPSDLTEDQCRELIFAADSLSFNCQDVKSAVAKTGHIMFNQYFPEGL